MTVYKIRFEGPAALAVGVATALADADGVDLTSSSPPIILNDDTVELNLAAEGPHQAVAAAVSSIGKDLPAGASIEIIDD